MARNMLDGPAGVALLELLGEMYATQPDVVFDSQRCIDAVEAFEAEARHKATEAAAMLVERWHIGKGGFTALAYHIREEVEAAPVEAALGGRAPGLYVIFNGPPGAVQSGEFVELEDQDGKGVGGVNWDVWGDGLWALGPFLKA